MPFIQHNNLKIDRADNEKILRREGEKRNESESEKGKQRKKEIEIIQAYSTLSIVALLPLTIRHQLDH